MWEYFLLVLKLVIDNGEFHCLISITIQWLYMNLESLIKNIPIGSLLSALYCMSQQYES